MSSIPISLLSCFNVMSALIEENTERWALAQLPYFRELGFFSDLADRSDAEILGKIYQRYAAACGLPYTRLGRSPPPWSIDFEHPYVSKLVDIFLLEFDHSRAWHEDEDTECIYPPGLAYADAISSWAAISRGVFAPSLICETWGGTEDEPTTPSVRIELPTVTLTLEPIVYNDWFDLSILVPINKSIRGSDIRFELYEQFDQTAFVVAVSPDEKEELIKTRRWSFHNFSV